MNEDEVIKIGKRYYESLFPRNCPNCQRRFHTLRDYLLFTTRVGQAHSYDAEKGDWKTENPIGMIMCTNCPCGTTIALSTDHMMLPLRLALLDWIRKETQRQGISPSELLEKLRDRVRQLVAKGERNMKIIYREGRKEDSRRIAELDNIASDGAIEFLFRDLIPNMSPVQIVASNFESDRSTHSYRNVIVAEHDGKIIGMSLSFPGKYHKITDEMREFFPHDRISHFKHFFSAPVEGSYFIDALCVEKDFRNIGIGTKLIELTKDKARNEGYDSICLLVFRDNTNAQNVYKKNGFKVIEWIDLPSHKLMPHEGGCFLMKAFI
jgi:GNAT superfamily N-acetyltransferase/uncharacterized C2H2 Zn-finger protein